jgi:preprotein translocase subunit YajC
MPGLDLPDLIATSASMLNLLSAAASPASEPPFWVSMLPLIGMGVIFWFLIIRPQMRRQKEHSARISALQKGDQVVTAGGLVGKVVKVDDNYAELELAQGVRVKAVKNTIGEILAPGNGAPAND